ncbi:ATP-dependent zinc metalloprotease FtsH [Helicovermis profundi]|uniref:ATP-dependent zinc metalloprotease FtsH n=1 Tax=Helicovermis profundi TaxID=3065157 RepID=A0AAU9EDP5_9FIRM|nr:ATP-dependent zinc metalloprotease FtsH [Clostridia bacterium S502]
MRKFFKGATFYILIFIVVLFLAKYMTSSPDEAKKFDVTQLVNQLETEKVLSVTLSEATHVSGVLKDGTKFESTVPDIMAGAVGNYLFKLSNEGKISLNGVPVSSSPWYMDLLPMVFMVLIFVVFWFVFMQNSQGGGSKVMSFGKSKAKLQKEDEQKKITFSDLAGLKEEKEEMWEVVDFLKNPKKYINLGARIPKGILMVGPPGTGKTYLSRAVAGEAKVPFYSISGSEFVEMFVGVGASRVRDLFDQAKKTAPCIVFIDEIDAVGRKRGAGLGGGHDEREQTLNQLLVEMDGFSDNQGIIVIAATNRPDILDPALLRAGRFDRQITIGIPDVREREEMLILHSKKKPVSDSVDFKVVAKGTPGFTPADLENLMNEAALLTARKGLPKITMPIIEDATIKVIAGVEKKSRVISPKEKKLTAYHEAGHAILARLLPDTDPVHKISIIPRGRAGGFTLQLPEEDRSYSTKKFMENELVILLGGRISEKLILDDISTGASNDLNRVSSIARSMVTRYAFSDNLGSMSYDNGEEVFIGRDMTTKRNYSEQVAADIDREVRRIVDNAYDKATEMLEEQTIVLHEVAKSLMEYETLDNVEFELAFNEGFDAVKAKRDEDDIKRKAEEEELKKKSEAEKFAFDALANSKVDIQKNDKISDDEKEAVKEIDLDKK